MFEGLLIFGYAVSLLLKWKFKLNAQRLTANLLGFLARSTTVLQRVLVSCEVLFSYDFTFTADCGFIIGQLWHYPSAS